RPVGSNEERPTNAWVIAATHVDLHGRMDSGRFREDLFHRLNIITLAAPSLAERAEDIPELASAFGERVTPEIVFDDDALEWLARRSWDGNVRELRSFIERVATFERTRPITLAHLEAIAARPGLHKATTRASAIERIVRE